MFARLKLVYIHNAAQSIKIHVFMTYTDIIIIILKTET